MKDARAPHMTIGFPSSPSVPWPYGVTEPWHTRCAMGGPCAEITQRPRGRVEHVALPPFSLLLSLCVVAFPLWAEGGEDGERSERAGKA